MLIFNVTNQELRRVDNTTPATDSKDYLQARFTVTDDWNGATLLALWKKGTTTYTAKISGGVCTVPAEVLARDQSAGFQRNKVFVTLVGENGTKRITTNELRVDLDASGYADGETPAPVTPDAYAQYVQEIKDDNAATVAEMRTLKDSTETAANVAFGVVQSAKTDYANAVKGNLSGAVVFADDVSPVEHYPVITVHGKNLFNPDYLVGTHSLDALSTWGNIIVDETGITKMLKPNTVYTLSFTAECVKEVEYATFQFSGIGMILYNRGMEVNMGRYWSVSESDWLSLGETKSFTKTFTTPSTLDGWCVMGYTQRALDSDGNAVTNVLKFTDFQIEEGETATEYEAWLDPSTVTVTRYGKNLLKNTLTDSSSCGVTRNVNADGSITFTGTGTEVHGIGINASIHLPDGKYIISGGMNNLYLVIWGMSVETSSWVSIAPDKGSGAEFVADSTLYSHYLAQYQGLSGVTYGHTSYPMIRAASVADASYEAYKTPAQYTTAADGTVTGITTVSPTMTVLTDTAGAIVDVEYNRDTNKVIQRLVDALAALGGTV